MLLEEIRKVKIILRVRIIILLLVVLVSTITFIPYQAYAVVPPTVTAITPNINPSTGGGSVTITGTNFTGATSVTIGGTTATNVVVVNDTTITAVTPAGAVGAASITVTTPGGTGTGAGLFTYYVPFNITGITPKGGPLTGGTAVTITGTGFIAGSTYVRIGGTPLAGQTVVNSTTITGVTPIGIAGVADVYVTHPYGAFLGPIFTYYNPPVATGTTPNAGPISGGTVVTITGTNFTSTTGVSFAGIPAASYTVNSNTQITATTPAVGAAAATGAIITTLGGSCGGGPFTYYTPPIVTGITPNNGPTAGSTSVTITGSNFTGVTSVTIGSAAATFTVVNTTTITATAPAGTTGAQNVTVTTPGGTGIGTSLFTYIGAVAGFRINTMVQQTAGTAFPVTITAVDSLGNINSTYQPANNIHFATTAGTAPNGISIPALPADSKPVFLNGVATINGFTLYKAETNISISVSELTTANTGSSNLFNVSPAAATTLQIQ